VPGDIPAPSNGVFAGEPSAINGQDRAVYVWVRTTDQGDHSTLLEIGTAAPTG
jgi:hypothetical protein